MANRAEILYFSAFSLAVFSLVFHLTAMGHPNWKEARRIDGSIEVNSRINIGLFKRCYRRNSIHSEICELNIFPRNDSCFSYFDCLLENVDPSCRCDFLPSSKGIAASTILSAIFLGSAVILIFFQSIKTSESRFFRIILGFIPAFLLLFTWIWMLIGLILVGSYLSRDLMHVLRFETGFFSFLFSAKVFLCFSSVFDRNLLLERVQNNFRVRVGWATGLEIIALVLDFFAWLLYSIFVFTA